MAYICLSNEEFASLVRESTSYRQVTLGAGLSVSSRNYDAVKKKIDELHLDTAHFTGLYYLKGKHHNRNTGMSLQDILVKDSPYRGSTTSLKAKLIKAGLVENRCSCCGITEWMGKAISIQIEHKNGNNTDNRRENLTMLCPNCHSQTPTYCGRNLHKYTNRARLFYKYKRWNLGCYRTADEAKARVAEFKKLMKTMSLDAFEALLVEVGNKARHKERIVVDEDGKVGRIIL